MSDREIETLADALAYLKPDPANNGTISLRAPKARQAVERIEREFVRLDAIISDKVADTRLVHMGPKGDGFEINLVEGPIPYLCEYLAQFMGHGSDGPLSNYAEIEVQHHEIGPMTLTIQRRAGKTPHQIAVAATEEAMRLREELAALRAQDREDGARWKPTGSGSAGLNAGGTVEWFRPSDGLVRSFPRHFDPNKGAYSGVTVTTGADLSPARKEDGDA